MCYDLMQRYPDKYPTQEILAKSLGFSQKRISEWLNLYELSLYAATNIRDRIAKFEPKKKEKKTIV
jgi:uncharacterized HAD superfamily protein